MSLDSARTYSTTEVSELTGASYRMLDYWCREGRIPGQSPVGPGSGTPRSWTEQDVVDARRLVVVSWLRSASVDNILALLDDLGALKRIENELVDREIALKRGRPLELMP